MWNFLHRARCFEHKSKRLLSYRYENPDRFRLDGGAVMIFVMYAFVFYGHRLADRVYHAEFINHSVYSTTSLMNGFRS